MTAVELFLALTYCLLYVVGSLGTAADLLV